MRVITLHCRQVTSRDLMTSQHGRRRDDVNQQVAAVLTATGRTAAVTCRITLPSAGYPLNLQRPPPLKNCPFSLGEFAHPPNGCFFSVLGSTCPFLRRHLDWFSRFRTAHTHSRDLQTHTHTCTHTHTQTHRPPTKRSYFISR